MSKPITAYTKSTKPVTAFSPVNSSHVTPQAYDDASVAYDSASVMYDSPDNTPRIPTAFTKLTKPVTVFAKINKNAVAYNRNSSTGSILLNSATVTLNSIVYRLSGYTGATPNQLNSKSLTGYTAL